MPAFCLQAMRCMAVAKARSQSAFVSSLLSWRWKRHSCLSCAMARHAGGASGRCWAEPRSGIQPWDKLRHRLFFAVAAVFSPAMAFTIRQLQFFIAVAEQGTVSRAAQNLSISQSSVTEAIKELESDLGVELFERHPRGLNITHKGHQFLRHATKILAHASDARRAFFGEQAVTGGRLQLGVTSLVAGYVLSDLLARYRRAYPGVEVSAIEDNGDYLE